MFRLSLGARMAGLGLLLTLGLYGQQTSVAVPGEGIGAARDTTPRPLLFELVTNQGGLNTEITIVNTSLNVPGSTAQSGTCSIQYYGPGAPGAQTTQTIPAGGQATFNVSGGGAGVGPAPGFLGYAIATCTFAHSRGLAVVSNVAMGRPTVAWSYEAERLIAPRTETTPTTLLFSFAANNASFDSRFFIANTSQDALGTVAQSGTCDLTYYGTGPATGGQSTVNIPAGQVVSFTLLEGGAGLTPRQNFEGYVIAQCNFRGARGIVAMTDRDSSLVSFSQKAERLTGARVGAQTRLLFPSVTNVGGRDTLITIANTSQDTVGTNPTTGTCTLNYYGRTAFGPAPAAQTTANILPGRQVAFTMSAGSALAGIAPTFSFDGYIIATCNFPGATGLATTADLGFFRTASAERAYVLDVPRTGETSGVLIPVASGRARKETFVRIANTSLDPFGTTAGNGSCTLNYINATGVDSQTSLQVPAGQSLTFSVGGGNPDMGIQPRTDFRGYIYANCTFPMARGSAFVVEPRATVLWQNDATNQTTIWYMTGSGGNVVYSWDIFTAGVPGWRIVAVKDFNKDGYPDLVWQNQDTRQASVWYMGGPDGNQFLGWNWLQSEPLPGWRIVGAHDFNRDGSPDLLWQNDTSRQATVWYMSGPAGNLVSGWAWISAAGVPGWEIAGTGDFNGDGTPDIIWQNSATRQATVWYMEGPQGNTFTNWAWIQSAASPGWRIAAINDLNLDRMPNILWQNDTTRQVTIWYMRWQDPGGLTLNSWDWLHAGGLPGWRVVGR